MGGNLWDRRTSDFVAEKHLLIELLDARQEKEFLASIIPILVPDRDISNNGSSKVLFLVRTYSPLIGDSSGFSFTSVEVL